MRARIVESVLASALLAMWTAAYTALTAAQAPAPTVSASATTSPQRETFSVVSNGEIVGSLLATVSGNVVDIDYRVSNNGRGPKVREHIQIGANGIPSLWTVDGSSLFGGTVKERFETRGKRLRWESQADRGQLQSKESRLYAVNDGSPWSFGLYARALLRAPGQRLAAAPSGEMRIEKLEEATLGEAERAIEVGVYAITGVGLIPTYVLLDPAGNLFAQIGSGVDSTLVRTGYEKEEKALRALAQSMDFLQLERIQTLHARRFDKPVRIRNVRIFDARSGRLSAPSSVVVFRNRIASISADTPGRTPGGDDPADADEVLVDGAGGTLVPGLHDMHSHNAPWSGLFRLAAGVTTARDMGNDNEALLDLTSRIDTGQLPGPHIIRAGLIEGRSDYSARLGIIPSTLPEALGAVRWYAEHGYRQIKIYNSMAPDWVKPLAAKAHGLGMRVSGHVPAFMSPDRAIRDGYDEINHINQLMLGWLLTPDEDTRTPLRLTAMGERAWALDLDSERVRNTLALFKEHHTALDTTAVILERLMLSRAGQVNPGDAPYLDHVPIGYQRYRKRSFVSFKSPEEDEHYVRSVRKIIDTLALLHREGVRLLPGTDDETGFTLHRELELYVAAGIPPAEVLRMATLDCDTYMGRDQGFGSIEVGKHADFFLVPGDPTQDIRAVRQIRLVMKDGALYFPSELYTALGIRPFAEPPHMVVPAGARPPPGKKADAGTDASGQYRQPPLTEDMTTSDPPIESVTTRHRVRIGKQAVPYAATFWQMPLNDANGVLRATISSTAYVREDVRDAATRPVMFFFNGGPGASSTPLHFSAFGPRRFKDKGAEVVDNAESLLDIADLVFVDPVGTGFNRLRAGADQAAYWSVDGDARIVLDLIRAWLRDNRRMPSPLYVAGESYGGYRLARLAPHAADLNLQGLIFLSPMLDASGSSEAAGNDAPFIFSLPTMAAAAWQHEKVDRRGKSVEQFFDEAAAFAESEYALALLRGTALSAVERDRIAARMARFIGLPASTIAAANLRVATEDFLQTLVPDRVVGRLDVRITGPKPTDRPKDRSAAADDPALGLQGSNIIKSARARDYLTRELRVQTPLDYLALTLDVNFRWQWNGKGNAPEFYVNAAPNVATLMAKRPQARVLLLGGLFDLAVPVSAARYALGHAGVPPDRVTMKAFVAGHSPFDSDESRAQVSATVRQFLLGSPPPAAEPTFEMALRPVRAGGREVTAIEVKQRIDGVPTADGMPLSFSAPVVYAAVTGIAERIEGLTVSDANGALPLKIEDDAPVPGGFPYFRHWRATRAVSFPVLVSYSALVQPPGSPNGPAFGIRPSGGGISGSGGGFLLLPENAGTTVSRVSWDLGDMPAGSAGVTTFGDGPFELRGAPDALRQGWILAGPAQRYSATGGNRFEAYWLGPPPFDAQAEMAWTANAYACLAKSFGYLDPAPPFRVFMRALDTPPYGGGTALGNSFMLSMSREKMKGSLADLRETFFHEMSHQWVGGIEGDYTVIAWFVEGLNVYYTTVLPLRGNLIPVEEYGARVNHQARQYYESPARDWSAAKIGAAGFSDEAIRHTPYVRGALYFADLDWRIRQRSQGRRDLDSFLQPMFVSRQAGKRFDVPAWEEMLRTELGEQAVEEFRASMLEGTRTVAPASEAFGPCFRREAVQMKAASGPVEGYQWRRMAGVPEERCRKW